MLMRMSASRRTVVKAKLVNWLAALVEVEDLRLAEPRQSFLEGRHAKTGIHGVRQSPG